MLIYAVVLAISLYFYHPLWFVLTMLTIFVLAYHQQVEQRRKEDQIDRDFDSGRHPQSPQGEYLMLDN